MATDQRSSSRIRALLKRRSVRVLAVIVVVIVAFRIMLPYVVLHYANKALAGMKGYHGHIDDIDLSLYRGSYQVQTLLLDKKDARSGKRTEFFRVKEIDLSVEWKALFRGRISGEIAAYSPWLKFTADTSELEDVKKDTADFRKVMKDLMPLNINRLDIHDGTVLYADRKSKPPVDIALRNIEVRATNLNNDYDSTNQLPADVRITASAYGGSLDLSMKLDPLASEATFDLNAELKDVQLTKVNDFLKAYGGFDVNRGTFGLYTEMAAKEGRFKGYVKPVIKDLDVVGIEDKKDNFLRKAWEGMVGLAGDIFKNHKKDQVATNIPLQGNFKSPRTNTWEAVWEVLKNAFVRALMPTIDDRINLSSVGEEEKEKGGLLKRIFSNDDKKSKKKEK